MAELKYQPDQRDIKTILEYIEKQYIAVGKTLQDELAKKAEEKGETFNPRPYMESQRLYVWKLDTASELIQELLMHDYSIPEMMFYRFDDRSQFRKVCDGQQRLTTVYMYVNNMFALDLSKTIYPIFTIEGETYLVDDLQGKKFSDLPELWQDIILGRTLRWSCANNCDEDTAEKIYVRRNSNTKLLRPVEIRKAAMGTKTRLFLENARKADWLLHAMTQKAAEGNQGDDVFAHVVTLLDNALNPIPLDKDSVNPIIYKYRDSGLPVEIEKKIAEINDYLNKVTSIWIEDKKEEDENKKGRKASNYNTYRFSKIFDKTNTVMMMVAAQMAIENDIAEKDFSSWAKKFFVPTNRDYNIACAKGTDKKPSDIDCVTDRLRLIKEALLFDKETSLMADKMPNKIIKEEVTVTENNVPKKEVPPVENLLKEIENDLDNFDLGSLLENADKEDVG